MKKIILGITLLVVSFTNAQSTLIVDNNAFIDDTPSHVYTTFTAAIGGASNGDIILIQPSATSYGNITINKSVTVLGMGYAPELNNGETSQTGNITVSASDVKIAGINVNGWISSGNSTTDLLVEDCWIAAGAYANGTGIADITYRGNVIRNLIYLNATPTNSLNITITNNLIQNLGSSALQYFNDTTIFNNNVVISDQTHYQWFIFLSPNNFIAQNNIWLFTANNQAIVDQSGGNPIIHNNSLTYHYGTPTVTDLNGTGNLDNQNPFFVNIPANNPYWAADNDYNLGVSSAGNDAGTDGNDVGIYNGYYDFDMRGYPTELPYLTEMSIINNMVPAGSNLNVNLKANANKTN
ncbi:hypothetical protein [Xanthomarina sp. F2636L]|uniref:hypothetical protein n=1 Tax=Xanthomarina sp. F2636L TaxID=2996018 RepID=UPI00225E0366|nr:hypothetical protein [Xanthomarina sp. F2636L]MCX7550530.1 hypothetical protein [Xanthomarina sp. F2636L]